MKTKKVKYTKKFILSMAIATSIAITGCGQSTSPQEEPQVIGIEVNENYAEEMAGKQRIIGNAFDELNSLLERPDRDSDQWQDDTAEELFTLSETSKEILKMNPPVKYEEIHQLLSEAAEYNIQFVSAFSKGYDNDDQDLLEEAGVLLQLSRKRTQEANDLL